jgi:hypothetical protein
MSAEQLFELGMKKVKRDLRWFGIAEHFEESIFVMAHLCGLSAVPPWKRDLRNKGRTLVDDLPAATVDLIREVYRYDFMFYDHLLAIFRQRIAGMRFGPSLDEYKRACAGEYKDRILR